MIKNDFTNRYEQSLGCIYNIDNNIKMDLFIEASIRSDSELHINSFLSIRIFHKRFYFSNIDCIVFYQRINRLIQSGNGSDSIMLYNGTRLDMSYGDVNSLVFYNQDSTQEFLFKNPIEMIDFVMIVDKFQSMESFFINNIMISKNIFDIHNQVSSSIHKINSIEYPKNEAKEIHIQDNVTAVVTDETLDEGETIDITTVADKEPTLNDLFMEGIDKIIESGEVDYVKENIQQLSDLQLSTECKKFINKSDEYEIKKQNLLFGCGSIKEFHNKICNLLGKDFDINISNTPYELLYKADNDILFLRMQYVKDQIEKNYPTNKHPYINSTIAHKIQFIDDNSLKILLTFLYSLIKHSDDNKLMLLYKVLLAPYMSHIINQDINVVINKINQVWSTYSILFSDVSKDDIINKLTELKNILGKLPIMTKEILTNILISKNINLIDYTDTITYSENLNRLFQKKNIKKEEENKPVIESKQEDIKLIELPDEFKDKINFEQLSKSTQLSIQKLITLLYEGQTYTDAIQNSGMTKVELQTLNEFLLRFIYISNDIISNNIQLDNMVLITNKIQEKADNIQTYAILSLFYNFAK